MGLGIDGLKVLVTASTRGIGRGIAEALLDEGCNVFINGLHEETVRRAVEELQASFGGRVAGAKADLRVGDEVVDLVGKAVEFLGGLDALVYVTGPPKAGYFQELSSDDWEEGINLLVRSAIILARESLPYLKRSRNPSIVFLTSVAVKEPIPNIALSNTLRIAVHGLMKTLARELGPEGIKVNAVMPGYIMTDRVRYIAEDRARREGVDPEEVIKGFAGEVPLRRVGQPREVGYVVAFLLSRYASYVNGAAIPVDGGLLKSQF
ncbi:MAG: SDR family oxidoreductase [Desulfurococcales archaeon]|nr:SDR family oxidoreductase [Desulfurococcales archaeon]